jgi:hypothetical protein
MILEQDNVCCFALDPQMESIRPVFLLKLDVPLRPEEQSTVFLNNLTI